MPNSAPMLTKIRLGSKLRVSLLRAMRCSRQGTINCAGIHPRPSRSPATSIPQRPAIPNETAFLIAWPPCEYMTRSVSPVGILAGKRSESIWIICRLSGTAMNKPRYKMTAMNKVSCHQTNL